MPNTKISRSAKTGKLISKKKAAKNPKTTVTETVTGYQRHKKEVIAVLKEINGSANYWQTKIGKLLKKIQ